MNRRNLLAATGTAMSLSGCLGYQVRTTESIEAKESRLAELNDEIERLESDLNSIETQRDNLRREKEAAESESRELKQSIVEAKEDAMRDFYDTGFDVFASAEGDYEQALRVYETNSSYALASRLLARCMGKSLAAEESFDKSAEYAEELEYEQATEMAQESSQKAELFYETSEHYSNAMEHYSFGEQSLGDDDLSRGSNSLEDYNDLIIETTTTFVDSFPEQGMVV